MNIDLLITRNLLENVNSWTLTSRIGEMLEFAENKFGKKDDGFFFLGTEFISDGPRIRYQNPKYIIIQLSPFALSNEYIAYYQLSHEVYHLLSPTGIHDSNNLEEGLATYFSRIYLEKFNQTQFDWEKATRADMRYYDAFLNVEKLLKIKPDIIKLVRTAFPNIKVSHLTTKEFESIMNENTPYDLLNILLSPFPNK